MRRLVAILVGFVTVSALITPAIARQEVQPEVGTLDQSQRQSSNWTAGQTVGLDQTVGQVFTAGLSGPLTAVWLGLWSAASTTPGVPFPDAIVEIRSVDPATGLPTETVLAQAQVPNAALPASGDLGVLVTFTTPPVVEAGTCYLVVARAAEDEHAVACCNWSLQPALGSGTSGDPYVDGTMLTQYVDQPLYYPFDLSDMTFETYVRQE